MNIKTLIVLTILLLLLLYSRIVAILSPQPPLFLHLSFCLLLHGPFLSPQTSQIQFSPISRGGINWSVCRSNSLGTLHSTHWPVHASSRNWRKLDLRGLRRMNWTTAALHCTVLHSTILYCTTLYYTVLYCTLLYSTVLDSTIYGVRRVMINISIRYGSEWVTFCRSYVFCHKMVTNGRILVFEVSIESYWALL